MELKMDTQSKVSRDREASGGDGGEEADWGSMEGLGVQAACAGGIRRMGGRQDLWEQWEAQMTFQSNGGQATSAGGIGGDEGVGRICRSNCGGR